MTNQNAQKTNRAKLPRPVIGQTALNLVVAAYILAVLNGGFWNRLIDIFGNSPLEAALFSIAILAQPCPA